MRKFVLLFFTLFSIVSITTAQQETHSKLWLGLSSDVTSQPISDVALLPSLLFFPIKQVGIGGSGFYFNDGSDEYKGVELRVRVYATNNTFIQGGIVSDLDAVNGYLVEAGYTSFLGDRFYVEPSFRFLTIDDTDRLSLALGVGLKL